MLGHPWARRSTHKPPLSGYDMTSLLPCSLPFLGKARGVNPNRKSGAVVPKVVWQDYATPATPAALLVTKQYQRLSFPWIHRPRAEGDMLPGQQLFFNTPCPGYVAPLERTLQCYSITSFRWKDANDNHSHLAIILHYLLTPLQSSESSLHLCFIFVR